MTDDKGQEPNWRNDPLEHTPPVRGYRPMKPTAHLRYVWLAPQVKVLEQGWIPADGSGGHVEWRRIPEVDCSEFT